MSCSSHGHLFCRECAVTNLLAQNKELKRLKKEAERRRLEDDEERDMEDAEKKARDLENFERVQAGMRGTSNASYQTGLGSSPKGTKRKLEGEDDDVRQANGEEKKVKRRESDLNGKNEDSSSFWIPSKIPDNKKADLKAIKHHPTCPAAAADQPHDFTLKGLTTVQFTEDKRSDTNALAADSPTRTCPSCNKALSNSTRAILAKPCGHVLCKPCSDKFQRPPPPSAHDKDSDQTVNCYVCSEDVTPGRRRKAKKKDGKEESVELGLVEISSDGTGFAGGGKSNMVKKEGVAFQC